MKAATFEALIAAQARASRAEADAAALRAAVRRHLAALAVATEPGVPGAAWAVVVETVGELTRVAA